MKINEKFKQIIPALSAEEYRQLEENCINEGIRDVIVIWNDFIIDGHNRHEIALKNDLQYKTINKEFESEEDVIEWIILNQFGRRNINSYDRSVLALRLEDVFREKAKQNEILGGKIKGCQTSDNPQKEVDDFFGIELNEVETLPTITPIDTKKELAKIAGVSHDTIAKVKKIEATASKEEKESLKAGKTTINAVYKEIKKNEDKEKEKQKKIETIEKSKQLPKIENVICGDSAIETLSAPKNIKCVICDPPFGCNFISNRREVKVKDEGIVNDDSLEKALEITKKVYTNLYNKMSDDSVLFSFIRWKEERYFMEMIESIGFQIRNSIIWVKNNHGSGDITGAFSPRHERIIFAVKGNPKLNFRPDDVLQGKEIVTEHVTSKPIDLLKVFIESTTLEGDLVVDAFAGHGSTGIAAKQTNRNFWLCEIDEYNYSQIKINLSK